jgi:hypothetical protein
MDVLDGSRLAEFLKGLRQVDVFSSSPVSVGTSSASVMVFYSFAARRCSRTRAARLKRGYNR